MAFLKKYWGIIAVIFLSVFSFFPFLQQGFFTVHDNTQVERVYEMGKALSDGMFPVRWVQDLGYGYGYPIFNFYSPFSYYLGGFINLAGFDALLATKLAFILGIVLSSVSMYLFASCFFGRVAGVVAGTSYLYFPYHAVNIYVRGDLAESYAYAFLPLVFLSFYKIHYISKKHPKLFYNLKWIIIGGVSCALVVISHNLSVFMLFMFLGLFIVTSSAVSKNKIKLISFYFLALLLGFSISAFYSVPALFEMKYTNVLSQVGGGAHFADHFVCPSQFWDSLWGFGGSTKGCLDGMSYKLGKSNVLFSFFSLVIIVYLFIKKKQIENRFLYVSSIGFLLFSLFMQTNFSEFIWNLISPMAFLQYPWRFLNFTSVFASFLLGVLIINIGKIVDRKIAVSMALIVLFFTFLFNAKLFNPQSIDSFPSIYYISTDRVRWDVSKISDEYLPASFSKPRLQTQLKNEYYEIIRGKGKVQDEKVKTGLIESVIHLDEGSIIRLNIAYFPAWKLFVNEKDIQYKVENDGLYFRLVRGKNKVEAGFVQTSVEKLANTLTIVGIFTVFLGIIWQRSNKKYDKKTS